MSKTARKPNGFLMAELIVSFTLLGVIVTGLAISTHGFGLFNRYQWTRQQCLAAAEAQLDSLALRATAIDPQTCERLWPGVTVSAAEQPGTGQWAGLQRIEVTATAMAGRRQVSVQLARYVRARDGEPSL